jgi:hypothetical protein
MSTQEQRNAHMKTLAGLIDNSLGTIYEVPMGFMLISTPKDASAGNVCDYIGNVSRETSIEWLRETADRLERNETHAAG